MVPMTSKKPMASKCYLFF